MMSRKIAITIGDIQGIGIEILIKSWREKGEKRERKGREKKIKERKRREKGEKRE